MDYELGFETLKACLVRADRKLQSEFATLEERFKENERAARLFGSSENTRNERNQIVHALNNLALEHCGVSFNDLCRGKSPTPKIQTTPGDDKAPRSKPDKHGHYHIQNRTYERAIQSDPIILDVPSSIRLSSPSPSEEPVRERRKRSRLIADNCPDVTISFDFLLEQTEELQNWAGIRLRGKKSKREGYLVIVRWDGRVEIVLIESGSEQILASYMFPHTSHVESIALFSRAGVA